MRLKNTDLLSVALCAGAICVAADRGTGWLTWLGATIVVAALAGLIYVIARCIKSKRADANELDLSVAGTHIIKRGKEISSKLARMSGKARQFPARLSGLSMRASGGVKNARADKIRRFCRMKVNGQTVIWVRLRGGCEYCFYLGMREQPRHGAASEEEAIANTRWEVKRVEGGEFGDVDGAVKAELRARRSAQ